MRVGVIGAGEDGIHALNVAIMVIESYKNKTTARLHPAGYRPKHVAPLGAKA